MEKYNYIK